MARLENETDLSTTTGTLAQISMLLRFAHSPEAALLLVSTKNRNFWEGNCFILSANPIRFLRLDSWHAQSEGKSLNRELPMLDLPRGPAASGDDVTHPRTQSICSKSLESEEAKGLGSKMRAKRLVSSSQHAQ